MPLPDSPGSPALQEKNAVAADALKIVEVRQPEPTVFGTIMQKVRQPEPEVDGPVEVRQTDPEVGEPQRGAPKPKKPAKVKANSKSKAKAKAKTTVADAGEASSVAATPSKNDKAVKAQSPAHERGAEATRPKLARAQATLKSNKDDLETWVRSREAMVPDLWEQRLSTSTVVVTSFDDHVIFDGEVKLQVYHLAKAVKAIGLPIYHTGVEVYGVEHFYCVNGVEWCWPKGYGQGVHKLAVTLGKTKLSNTRVEQVLKKMSPKWPGKDYKLLSHNCQSFAVELVSVLLPGTAVPNEYCRFAGAKPPAKTETLARRY
mmetsp:Transcript_72066/g.168630  ORF Transcript_72066/g.168630 Transcript_72066/m.168630 type:complete len:316 (-) Transcript_72066:26-973(-)